MSLKPCPECGHEVSDRAPACPSCGFPLAEDPVLVYTQHRLDFAEKVAIGAIVVAAVFALLGFVTTDFLPFAFGGGFVGVLILFRVAVARAQLDKSKLKR